MMKAHCDNCDALIVDANPARLVTVQPYGYQCVVTLTIRKEIEQEICADCLLAAALSFVESLRLRRAEHPSPPVGGLPNR